MFVSRFWKCTSVICWVFESRMSLFTVCLHFHNLLPFYLAVYLWCRRVWGRDKMDSWFQSRHWPALPLKTAATVTKNIIFKTGHSIKISYIEPKNFKFAFRDTQIIKKYQFAFRDMDWNNLMKTYQFAFRDTQITWLKILICIRLHIRIKESIEIVILDYLLL